MILPPEGVSTWWRSRSRIFPLPVVTLSRALAAFALLSVLVSLAWRIGYRGEYFSGWELFGAAEGEFLFSTTSVWAALARVFHRSLFFWYWNTSNSLIYTVAAGAASLVFPGLQWGAVVTFGLVLVALALVVMATGLPWRQGWLVLLAWGASPTLLSFSVFGHSFASAILPWAIALVMVLAEPLRKSFWKTAALGLVAIAVSWQLYEAGRLMLLVWGLGVFLLGGIPWRVRVAWLALCVAQVAMLVSLRSASTFFLDDLPARLDLGSLAAAGALFVDRLFVHPTLSLPVLFVLGIAALFLKRENRYFWIAVMVANLGMLALLALRGDLDLYSRRFNVMEFTSIAVIVALLAEHLRTPQGRRYVVPAFLGLLALGNLAQIGTMIAHFRTPVSRNEHPLPFTWSRHDLKVYPDQVAFADEVRDWILAGNRAILLYNHASEWPTDPAAVPDRLYLELGHRRFVASVLIFGKEPCNCACLPIRRPDELPAALREIAAGRLGDIRRFAVFSMTTEPARDLPGAEAEIRGVFETTPDEVAGKRRVFRLLAARPG